MFKFLKEKLKQSVNIFSKKIEETAEEETIEVTSEKTEQRDIPAGHGTGEATTEKSEEKGDISSEQDTFEALTKKEQNKVPEDEKAESKPAEESKEVMEVTEEKQVEQSGDLLEGDQIPIEEEAKEAKKEGFLKKFFKKKDEFEELEELQKEKNQEELKVTPLEDERRKASESHENLVFDVESPDTAGKEFLLETEQPSNTEKAEQPIDTASGQKAGFFSKLKEKVVTKKLDEKKFEEMFWDLEVVLLENNMAVQVIEKIKENLRKDIVNTPIRRNRIEHTILLSLRKSIEDILAQESFDIVAKSDTKKPYVICFIGINGSGKTTTIAKMARLFLDSDKTVVLAASDTFRAAAIDQLQIHAEKLGVKMIRHDYGSDPAAVAFDAIQYAKAKEIDVVLIDTAGRLHSNTNLVDEMKKIIRVAQPDLKIFVGEAITGNDCIEQAVKFNEAINIDGIILSKADIDEKGGASISISYVTKKPILYVGTGQEYSDIKPFDRQEVIDSLGLEA